MTGQTEPLSSAELADLKRHRNRTIIAFVIFELYLVAAMAILLLIDVTPATEAIVVGILLAGAGLSPASRSSRTG